ncbi:MAG: hypothetical protein ABI740_05095, partial [Alphaproteobacteria bacterium]
RGAELGTWMFRATEAEKGPHPMGNQTDKNANNPNPQNPDQRKNPMPQPQDGRQQQGEQTKQPQPGGQRPDPNKTQR